MWTDSLLVKVVFSIVFLVQEEAENLLVGKQLKGLVEKFLMMISLLNGKFLWKILMWISLCSKVFSAFELWFQAQVRNLDLDRTYCLFPLVTAI